MDKNKLYFIRQDITKPNVNAFRLVDEDDSNYVFQDIDNMDMLYIRKTEFAAHEYPMERLILNPMLMRRIFEHGSEDQRRVWVYTIEERIYQGEITMIKGRLLVLIGDGNFLSMDSYMKDWNAAFSREKIREYLVNVVPLISPFPGIHDAFANAYTTRKGNKTNFQIFVKLSFPQIVEIFNLLIKEDEEHPLTDGSRLDQVQINNRPAVAKEINSPDGKFLRIIAADPNGLYPWDYGVDPMFALQMKF